MPQDPEPHRLKPANYPFHWPLDTAFGDMDVAGHVNNVALARYYETGRTRWLVTLTGEPRYFEASAMDTLVAEIRFRFLREINFPHRVVVATAIGRIGNTSFSCLQGLFVDGECAGLGDAAMVLTRGGKPSPIEGELRQQMEKYLIRTE